jgi:6-phosphogluconolactonase (cycloisomerase 2 family)
MLALASGLLLSAAAASAEVGKRSSEPEEQFVYIGTHGAPGPRPGAPPPAAGDTPPAKLGPQGIYAARLNSQTGQLSPAVITAQLQRATWLVPHPSLPVIYSVADSGGGMEADSNIVSFAIDGTTGKLQLLNKMDAGGRDATTMAVDAVSNTLLVGNHGSGSVTAMPLLADGSLGPVASLQKDYGTGPNVRQKSPAAHGVAVDPTHKYVVVADFSADRLFLYRFDGATRALSPADPPFEPLPAGTGPRHLLFHPNGRFLILVSELTGELRSYGWNAGKGHLSLIQTISPYPANYAGEKSGAEIAVSRDGHFVYLSLRGEEDKILVYAFDSQRGTMREIQRIPAQGKVPWSFGIDLTGRWMLVTNEASDSLVELKIDSVTGKLSTTDQAVTIPNPVTVVFYAR